MPVSSLFGLTLLRCTHSFTFSNSASTVPVLVSLCAWKPITTLCHWVLILGLLMGCARCQVKLWQCSCTHFPKLNIGLNNWPVCVTFILYGDLTLTFWGMVPICIAWHSCQERQMFPRKLCILRLTEFGALANKCGGLRVQPRSMTQAAVN